jgi:DNA processing protein
MAEEISYWVALSLVPGVGSVLFKRLLDQFKTPDAVFRASLRDLLGVEGIGKRVAEEIRKGPPEKGTERELRLVKEAG